MISSLEGILQRLETAMLSSAAPKGVVTSSLPGETTVRLKQPSHMLEAYMMGRPQNLQPEVIVDGIVLCARLNLKSKLVREVEQSFRSCVSCISSSLSFAFSTASLSYPSHNSAVLDGEHGDRGLLGGDAAPGVGGDCCNASFAIVEASIFCDIIRHKRETRCW